MASTGQGIPESAVRMAGIHCSTLDVEKLHVDFLLAIDVSSNKIPPAFIDGLRARFDSVIREGVRAMRIRIQIGAVLLAATFLATFLSILLGCYPVEKHWQINPDPGSKISNCPGRLRD